MNYFKLVGELAKLPKEVWKYFWNAISKSGPKKQRNTQTHKLLRKIYLHYNGLMEPVWSPCVQILIWGNKSIFPYLVYRSTLFPMVLLSWFPICHDHVGTQEPTGENPAWGRLSRVRECGAKGSCGKGEWEGSEELWGEGPNGGMEGQRSMVGSYKPKKKRWIFAANKQAAMAGEPSTTQLVLEKWGFLIELYC